MRYAVVTGGSEGLGNSIIKALVDENWSVINLSKSKCEISKVENIKVDLTSVKDINKAVDVIKYKYKKLDLLVNNAGVLRVESLGKIKYSESDLLLKLNLLAPLYLISELKDLLLQAEGDIVNIGSTSAYKGRVNWGIYGASKWGLRGIHENLKEEFHDTNVRVSLINPPALNSKHFEKAGIIIDDMSSFIETEEIAKIIMNIINTPKMVQIGEVIINKKTVK